MQDGQHILTQLLQRWSGGDREALQQLVPLVYEELHRLAAGYLRVERRYHTLQPTALVNEAYLRLANRLPMAWRNHEHFYAVAAQIIRHVLVDHAREKNAIKRRGESIPLERALNFSAQPHVDLLTLGESLDRLAAFDPQKAQLVELRYFVGLTVHEVANVLKISPATVYREWAIARTWLYRDMMVSSNAERAVARG